MGFGELIALERLGEDTFVGRSPAYPWGGVYGGQLVAQALRAACATVDQDRQPHALHASYVRAARPEEVITYAVQRIRDGRRFATRGVSARQAGGTVMTMTAGFHTGEMANAADALIAPRVSAPDDLPTGGWSDAFECRYVPRETPGHVTAWVRLTGPAEADGAAGPCVLAYLADDLPGDAALDLMPQTGAWRHQSLDHNVWFHRAPSPDGWQLHDLHCHGVAGGRALVIGRAFDQGGDHVATVGQEVLVRRGRAGAR